MKYEPKKYWNERGRSFLKGLYLTWVSIPFTPLAKVGIKALNKYFPKIPVICRRVHPTLVPEKNKGSFRADILLLYPPTDDILDYQPSIPCLASYLVKHGFKVDALDAPALGLTIEEIRSYVKENPPKTIGISTPFTPLAKTGIETVKALKKSFPKIPVICGGVHPTCVPEEILDYADFVCIGEGEITLKEFLERYLKGEDCRKELVNLDSLPPPLWDIVAVDKYKEYLPTGEKAMPIILSRGCPFSCNFCANWFLSCRTVRYRKMEDVIQQIKHYIKKYKVKAFDFHDENFTLNRKRVLEFCDELIKEKLGIHWWAQTRANLLDPEILRKMKEAGCVGISIGVESGDEEVLRKIHKGVTLEEMKRAVKMIKEAKLISCADFMIGHPWDTPETVLATIRFADELDVDFLGYALAQPYPKTELRKTAEEQGAILTNDWSKYITSNVTYIPPGLKGYDLKVIRKIAVINFYSQSIKRLYNMYKFDTIKFLLWSKDLLFSYLRIKVTSKKYPENLDNAKMTGE